MNPLPPPPGLGGESEENRMGADKEVEEIVNNGKTDTPVRVAKNSAKNSPKKTPKKI